MILVELAIICMLYLSIIDHKNHVGIISFKGWSHRWFLYVKAMVEQMFKHEKTMVDQMVKHEKTMVEQMFKHEKTMVDQMVKHEKTMVEQMVLLFEAKGGLRFAFNSSAPRGAPLARPPTFDCPFGANEQHARPLVLDNKIV
ncbi:hypothetical protein [Methanocella conradii]|uniref:hypothetical protein n=1 Tax=Methanocella conradii TaxID=1175444 RepID=UPI00157DF4EA|nr:hypothetical protein [Methanocella conradii]